MPFVQEHHSQALPDNLPCINVYTLPSIDSRATEPQLIASYGLPPFVSVATVNAPPNSVAHCTDKSSPPALVFVTLISMLYWVPMSVFVKEDDAVDAFQTCHPQPRMVPWEEWGPKNTRFMECTIRSSWLRLVFRVSFPWHRFLYTHALLP